MMPTYYYLIFLITYGLYNTEITYDILCNTNSVCSDERENLLEKFQINPNHFICDPFPRKSASKIPVLASGYETPWMTRYIANCQ